MTGRALSAILLTAAVALVTAAAIPLLAPLPATAATPGASQEAPERPEAPKPPAPRSPGEATSREGQSFFFDREAGPAGVSCADCHAIHDPAVAPRDDRIRPGHNLFDAFGRGNWWNSRITTDCGEAAEVCFKRFVGARELPPWARVALVKYMKSRSAPVSNPWILLRIPPGRTPLGGADAGAGRDLFRRACALCHPGGAAASEGKSLAESTMTLGAIADLIRTGQGRMPFFQMDILTHEQVADIAAYTHSLQPGR